MQTFIRLSLFSGCALIFCLSASPVFSIEGIRDDDHASLVKYYETMAADAKMHLYENKSQLDAYESHPYYFGRQGQDFRSHTQANIQEYEKQLNESLRNVELHKKILSEQHTPINKAIINLKDHASAVR